MHGSFALCRWFAGLSILIMKTWALLWVLVAWMALIPFIFVNSSRVWQFYEIHLYLTIFRWQVWFITFGVTSPIVLEGDFFLLLTFECLFHTGFLFGHLFCKRILLSTFFSSFVFALILFHGVTGLDKFQTGYCLVLLLSRILQYFAWLFGLWAGGRAWKILVDVIVVPLTFSEKRWFTLLWSCIAICRTLIRGLRSHFWLVFFAWLNFFSYNRCPLHGLTSFMRALIPMLILEFGLILVLWAMSELCFRIHRILSDDSLSVGLDCPLHVRTDL